MCRIERFQVRNEKSIKNNIFCALKAFVQLELLRFNRVISNWYEISKNLYLSTIRNFIIAYVKCSIPVNA